MKATTLILLSLSGLVSVQAQQGPPPGGPPPKPPVMTALDTDKDGVLSAEEIENASQALAEMDTDGNGRLSEDEFKPESPKGEGEKGEGPPRGGGEPPAHPVMTALDQNGSGTLSKREMSRASKSLLELDEDENGILETEEMEPERPEEGSEAGPSGGGGPEGGRRGPRPPRGGR